MREELVLAASADPEAAYTSQVLPEKLALSDNYILHWSFSKDIQILVRTLLAVFGIGAARGRSAPTTASSPVNLNLKQRDKMLKHLAMVKWRQAAPRILADLIVIHLSMVAALAVSAVYALANGKGGEAQALVSKTGHYYVRQFVLLSPLFIVVFFLTGFYLHTRGYAGNYKKIAILRGVALAVMLFCDGKQGRQRRECR